MWFYLQKEMFLSREELQMSIKGAEDKEIEKQVNIKISFFAFTLELPDQIFILLTVNHTILIVLVQRI